MTISRISFVVTALLVSLVGSQSALAALVLVDNFETYTLGNVRDGNGSPPWTAIDNTSLVDIEDENGNQFLSWGWQSGQRGGYRGTTGIPEGSSGTYFFRYRADNLDPDHSFGLSDVAAPVSSLGNPFEQFEVQIALVPDDDPNQSGQLEIKARSGGALVDIANNLDVGTWYNIWLDVNNSTDTYDVYFSTGTNDATTPAATGLGFRNGLDANDLITLFAWANNAPIDNAGHVDDIYFSSTLDLTNPIPEPTSVAILSVSMVLVVSRGARRRA